MTSVVAGAMRVAIPGVLVGVSALLTATAVVASLIPARRATKADPTLALRGEA